MYIGVFSKRGPCNAMSAFGSSSLELPKRIEMLQYVAHDVGRCMRCGGACKVSEASTSEAVACDAARIINRPKTL